MPLKAPRIQPSPQHLYIVVWTPSEDIGECQYVTDSLEDAESFSKNREDDGHLTEIFHEYKVITYIKVK